MGESAALCRPDVEGGVNVPDGAGRPALPTAAAGSQSRRRPEHRGSREETGWSTSSTIRRCGSSTTVTVRSPASARGDGRTAVWRVRVTASGRPTPPPSTCCCRFRWVHSTAHWRGTRSDGDVGAPARESTLVDVGLRGGPERRISGGRRAEGRRRSRWPGSVSQPALPGRPPGAGPFTGPARHAPGDRVWRVRAHRACRHRERATHHRTTAAGTPSPGPTPCRCRAIRLCPAPASGDRVIPRARSRWLTPGGARPLGREEW